MFDKNKKLDFDFLLFPPREPKSEEEEKGYVERFLSGLRKLLDKKDNWTFLMPLSLSLEYCAQCHICSEACPIYISSGRKEIYRPTFRSEILRGIVRKYLKPFGKLRAKIQGAEIELDFTLLRVLYELAYRCTLCRRCAQSCPMAIDNGLITREIRKLFSQELGWAPESFHEKGTELHLEKGSVTGMSKEVMKENIEFIEEDIFERTGIKIQIPFDKRGSEYLFLPSASEILSYPENFGAFLILLHLSGIDFTLSSEAPSYDGVNYGIYYDDIQLLKIFSWHMEIAKKLNIKRIVLGECGHEHKVFISVGERLLAGNSKIPVDDVLSFLERIVFSGKIEFDPLKNDFPVTLHDPCNIVRNLGIKEPQRRILRYLAPKFREMKPTGEENFCCGGGGGAVLFGEPQFKKWRLEISGKKKYEQILDAFSDCPSPDQKKYVCAPCLNCRIQLGDLFKFYNAEETHGLYFGGLSELIVNSISKIKEPYIKFEER